MLEKQQVKEIAIQAWLQVAEAKRRLIEELLAIEVSTQREYTVQREAVLHELRQLPREFETEFKLQLLDFARKHGAIRKPRIDWEKATFVFVELPVCDSCGAYNWDRLKTITDAESIERRAVCLNCGTPHRVVSELPHGGEVGDEVVNLLSEKFKPARS